MTMPDTPATTPLDREAIERRVNAATPGPWTFEPDDDGGPLGYILPADPHRPETLFETCNVWEQAYLDGEFVAHARTDIPALLSALRRSHTRIAELEAVVGKLVEALQPFAAAPGSESFADQFKRPRAVEVKLAHIDHFLGGLNLGHLRDARDLLQDPAVQAHLSKQREGE